MIMALSLKKIIIGGGTGFIGSNLTQFLKNEGYTVTCLSRLPGHGRMTWEDIKKFGIPKNTEAVINVAGENLLNPLKRWEENFIKEVKDSRMKTTELLAKAIDSAETKPKVFVSMSGVGIYKPDSETVYEESSQLNGGFDFISNLAHDWENASRLSSEDVRRVIIRSGVVLGRNGGIIKQLYLPFYFGLGGPTGSGNQYFPWIHVQDLCRLILFSVQNDKIKGVLNGVAPEIITNKEFSQAFAKALKRPAIFPLPTFICKILFGAERSVMLLEGQKVTPKKAIFEFGFTYLYSTINKACEEVVTK